MNEQPFLPPGRIDGESLAAQAELVRALPSLALMGDFPVALLVLNETRQIVYANERVMEYIGPGRDSALGLRPGEAFSCVNARDGADGCGTGPFCRYCGAARGLSQAISGMAGAQECSLDRSRAELLEQLDLLVWTKPIEVSGECFYLFAIIDISEKKRREALERIFLHDLMNTAGALSSLLRLIDPRESTYSEYFGLAMGAADQLVDELISHRMLADAEAGSLPAEFVPVSASDLAAAVGDPYRRIAESRGIRFETVAPAAPLLLRTDPVLLKRVLSNLCKNAIEASSRGNSVRLAFEGVGGRAEFSVSNPAVMPEAIRSQLFHRSFTTKGRGRGIGTYAARLFTEDFLRGSIRVESGEGKGTVFTVSLPLDPSPASIP